MIGKKNFSLFVTVVALVIGAVCYGVKSEKIGVEKPLDQEIFKQVAGNIEQPLPSPFPFQELTIPYLRTRSYTSALGERQLLRSTEKYQSYLTSYQSDGLRINGLLTQPTGAVPQGGWPAIVFIHGYIPPQQYATLERYEAYVDYLTKNGFVVFKIDLRGHGESDGEASGAYYSSDYIVDVLNAYAALQTAEFVNSDKIGLWGHSMAGNVALRAQTVKPEIGAIVIWAGAVFTYSDFQEYGISDASYQPRQVSTGAQRNRQELFKEYGQFDANSQFWKQVTPVNYLTEIKGSIQLHHSSDDKVVDVRYSQNLAALLTEVGVDHEYYQYQAGGHDLASPVFSEAMQRTVEFFQAKL